MKAQPLHTTLAAFVAQMDGLQKPIAERLRDKHPNARVMTAWDDNLRGVSEEGESMLVEPCDQFDDDGIYVLNVAPTIMAVRRLRLLCATGQVTIETTDGRPAELGSLADVRAKLDVVGKVVASCAVRLH